MLEPRSPLNSTLLSFRCSSVRRTSVHRTSVLASNKTPIRSKVGNLKYFVPKSVLISEMLYMRDVAHETYVAGPSRGGGGG